ncbi:MAG TPA: ATPase domain-containing protein, partial [Burkholderiaceae bacterium]|nr:ATPase domain-containing protein [Burkholderiaceae bacterium]
MASKSKRSFVCNACGATYPKWEGRCSSCNEWNTLVETLPNTKKPSRFASLAASSPILKLQDIDARELPRQPTGIDEFDRVLGGGLVSGGVVLLGGDPGIGKSTLLLQA